MQKVRIYRHPNCAKCARYAKMHRALDWLRRVETSVETPTVGPVRMGEVLVEDMESGKVYQGFEAFELICRAIPAYAPYRLLFWMVSFREYAARGIRGGHAPRDAGVIGR